MEIKGFIETSLVDWDGKIVSVLFLPECNFRCPYCHNHELVIRPENLKTVELTDIRTYILDHKNWIDGIVITGGEPTVHDQLDVLLTQLKELNLLIKLDTNGTHPTTIVELINRKLIDYVAMDIKAPLDERYYPAIGTKVNINTIKESVQILLSGVCDYEFRTTLVPAFIGTVEIEAIAHDIQDASLYVLQEFVPRFALDNRLKTSRTFTHKEILQMVKLAQKYVKKCRYRGR